MNFSVRQLSAILPRVAAILGWIALLAVIWMAAKTRFALAPTAMTDSDTWGWLNAGLSWVGGGGFRETYEREWLYGAFIAAGLKFSGSFAGLVTIQIVLGLLSGVLLWLAWRTWSSMLPRNVLIECLTVPIGLLLVAGHLFNPSMIAFELSIRPEAIMAATMFAQLACILLYCKFRWHRPNLQGTVIFGALSIPLAYALYILKPSWALAVPPTLFPIFAGMFGRALPFGARIVPPIAGVILVLVTLLLPEKALFVKSKEPRVVLPMTLFTMNADTIRVSFAEELRSPETSDERKSFLAAFIPLMDGELETARKDIVTYHQIGFDPDYLMYRAKLFPTLEAWGLSHKQITEFCLQSYAQAWKSHPEGMMRKVLRQLVYFQKPDRNTFQRNKIRLAPLYKVTLETSPESLDKSLNEPTRVLYEKWRADVATAANNEVELKAPRFFSNLAANLGAFLVPLAVVFFLVLIAVIAWPPLRPLSLPGLCAALLFSAPAGNAITIALVHALDNSRYRATYGSALMLAMAAMAVFVFVAAVYAVIKIRSRKAETA